MSIFRKIFIFILINFSIGIIINKSINDYWFVPPLIHNLIPEGSFNVDYFNISKSIDDRITILDRFCNLFDTQKERKKIFKQCDEANSPLFFLYGVSVDDYSNLKCITSKVQCSNSQKETIDVKYFTSLSDRLIQNLSNNVKQWEFSNPSYFVFFRNGEVFMFEQAYSHFTSKDNNESGKSFYHSAIYVIKNYGENEQILKKIAQDQRWIYTEIIPKTWVGMTLISIFFSLILVFFTLVISSFKDSWKTKSK